MQLLNSETAHFQKTREGCWRLRNQPVVGGPDKDAIVRHQARKEQRAIRCSLNEIEHEARFARTGGAANQDGPRAHQYHRRMNGGWIVHQYLHRRQSNDKARAKNPFLDGLIVALGVVAWVHRGRAILRRHPAVMCFYDLLRDRQAQA